MVKLNSTTSFVGRPPSRVTERAAPTGAIVGNKRRALIAIGGALVVAAVAGVGVAVSGSDALTDNSVAPPGSGSDADDNPVNQDPPADAPVYTSEPTSGPTSAPTKYDPYAPTSAPTGNPTKWPTASPTKWPTQWPTGNPTKWPTASPTKWPTQWPTGSPTKWPTSNPTVSPSSSPTKYPTSSPTVTPTSSPTKSPTASPTNTPSVYPTNGPTSSPTSTPTVSPTKYPTTSPTSSPTSTPTSSPTASPTGVPTKYPTTSPTSTPTVSPTKYPTTSPTSTPTSTPTSSPTASPTGVPTKYPTTSPTSTPTVSPTKYPTTSPTSTPTVSPTKYPTTSPTSTPTASPTPYRENPNYTAPPTTSPTDAPSTSPTLKPTTDPTTSPTGSPTDAPTVGPTSSPTSSPTVSPTGKPTYTPSPTSAPTDAPTTVPTDYPTDAPTTVPTDYPTGAPTIPGGDVCEHDVFKGYCRDEYNTAGDWENHCRGKAYGCQMTVAECWEKCRTSTRTCYGIEYKFSGSRVGHCETHHRQVTHGSSIGHSESRCYACKPAPTPAPVGGPRDACPLNNKYSKVLFSAGLQPGDWGNTDPAKTTRENGDAICQAAQANHATCGKQGLVARAFVSIDTNDQLNSWPAYQDFQTCNNGDVYAGFEHSSVKLATSWENLWLASDLLNDLESVVSLGHWWWSGTQSNGRVDSYGVCSANGKSWSSLQGDVIYGQRGTVSNRWVHNRASNHCNANKKELLCMCYCPCENKTDGKCDQTAYNTRRRPSADEELLALANFNNPLAEETLTAEEREEQGLEPYDFTTFEVTGAEDLVVASSGAVVAGAVVGGVVAAGSVVGAVLYVRRRRQSLSDIPQSQVASFA